jgi:KaiC/GvpD/RAD55 family RecA-like ATPase
MSSDESHGRLSHMADNIVFLDTQADNGVIARKLRIVKARSIAHDLQAREFQIAGRGLTMVTERR